ncbi:MAG: hypothetical protein EA376_03870 [Phycisphaeraceae bacterium]|nr:MAG: hypothetical protein EA376_03870 [Phycisphaeraceae bacterium]
MNERTLVRSVGKPGRRPDAAVIAVNAAISRSPAPGDVCIAAVQPARGPVKNRPIIVLSVPDADDEQDIVAVAVTSSPHNPSDSHFIHLPSSTDPGSTSGLERESWAACRWVLRLKVEEIRRIVGHISMELVERIALQVERERGR